MPRISEMMPSKYLKASDCEDGDLILTISDVKQERVGMGKDADDKWILYFEEEEKGLVLNKTNINTIAKLYGDDTDDWEGKKVALFATEVQFQSEMVAAIRIRSKPPKQKGEKAAAKPAPKPVDSSDNDPADESDVPF